MVPFWASWWAAGLCTRSFRTRTGQLFPILNRCCGHFPKHRPVPLAYAWGTPPRSTSKAEGTGDFSIFKFLNFRFPNGRGTSMCRGAERSLPPPDPPIQIMTDTRGCRQQRGRSTFLTTHKPPAELLLMDVLKLLMCVFHGNVCTWFSRHPT